MPQYNICKQNFHNSSDLAFVPLVKVDQDGDGLTYRHILLFPNGFCNTIEI